MNKMIIKYLEIPEYFKFDDAAKYLPLLSDEQQTEIKRYRYEDSKLTRLFAHLLLRNEIKEQTGLTDDQITIRRKAYGKPYLYGHDDFHFPISHSGRQIAIAAGENAVGIDIEIIKERRMKLAERFFLAEEYQYILDSDDMDEAFYYIWTRKEAYIKYTGEGLRRDLASFSTLNDKGKNRGSYRSFRTDTAMISIYSEHITDCPIAPVHVPFSFPL